MFIKSVFIIFMSVLSVALMYVWVFFFPCLTVLSKRVYICMYNYLNTVSTDKVNSCL